MNHDPQNINIIDRRNCSLPRPLENPLEDVIVFSLQSRLVRKTRSV